MNRSSTDIKKLNEIYWRVTENRASNTLHIKNWYIHSDSNHVVHTQIRVENVRYFRLS